VSRASAGSRRLKRVLGIQIEGCARCGGRLENIASIEETQVIAKILAHLEKIAPDQYESELPLGAGTAVASSAAMAYIRLSTTIFAQVHQHEDEPMRVALPRAGEASAQ
jgi:hypothetical protein